MTDDLGREPIPGVAGASGCPHPTQLPISIRWRNRGRARQVDGALAPQAMLSSVIAIPQTPRSNKTSLFAAHEILECAATHIDHDEVERRILQLGIPH